MTTIETVETFTADHALLVLDMVIKGYKVGLSSHVGEDERTTFFCRLRNRDIILINTTFFVDSHEINPDCIGPQVADRRRFNRFGNRI